jgi:hypothetical protein
MRFSAEGEATFSGLQARCKKRVTVQVAFRLANGQLEVAD